MFREEGVNPFRLTCIQIIAEGLIRFLEQIRQIFTFNWSTEVIERIKRFVIKNQLNFKTTLEFGELTSWPTSTEIDLIEQN